MNIYKVRENLVNTIAGKEAYLAHLRKRGYDQTGVATVAAEFVQVNIDELKKILEDVEVCCEQATNASWELNPERMGR